VKAKAGVDQRAAEEKRHEMAEEAKAKVPTLPPATSSELFTPSRMMIYPAE